MNTQALPDSSFSPQIDVDIDARRREGRVRRMLRKDGYVLRKSRARTWTLDNQLGYMIIDPALNIPCAGFRFDADLEEVERWATEPTAN